MSAPAPAESTRRSFKVLLWAALPVLALAGVVQITGRGIDVLVVAVGALLLLGVERSIGDWLGEWVGPLASAAIFVAAAVALSWYFLSESLGRSQTERFFVEAERRGYRTLYYPTPRSARPDDAAPPPAASGGATVVADRSGTVRTAPAGAAPASSSGAVVAPQDQDASGESTVPAAVSTTGGASSTTETGARRSLLSFFRRGTPARAIETDIVVSLSPPQVKVARQALISARVRANGSPVSGGAVEFMVNGLGAGRVSLDADGVASTTYSTHIAGTYEIRARYTGDSTYASSRSASVVLTVVR